MIPLVGANVIWQHTNLGTSTNEEGKFILPRNNSSHQLVVSYIGYKSDTIKVGSQNFIEIELSPSIQLDAVVIEGDKDLDMGTIQSELLTVKSLKKAACCNLSESFETNASVDVSTTDAVSGTKQIRMLGLDGVYAQIMAENIPSIRGLAARSGLYFIPGTWIKSIDINKGAGSVVNGYESITGQINIELAKPQLSEKLLFNFYANQAGRLEANLNTAHKLNEKWSTGFLLHGSNLSLENDWNDDGFMDTPKFTQLNAFNRWHYTGEKMEAQFGLKAIYDLKVSGQNGFSRNQLRDPALAYGISQEVKRLELFSKTGFFLDPDAKSSLGIITNGMIHRQNSFWGMSDYAAEQNYFLLNAIYQNKIDEKQRLMLGGSFVFDQYNENYLENKSVSQQIERQRTEAVPGIFAEYTFSPVRPVTVIAGLRSDFHNLFGTFLSPRLHFKLDIAKNTLLRLSGGRGFRVANPIVENISYLISSRQLDIANNLQPEIAWNFGGSLSQAFKLNGRKASIIADFYRTDFENQVVWDLDSSPDFLYLYNLQGSSFANSFQLNVEYELIDRLDVTMAYKYYLVKTTIGDQLREAPFIPKDRFFINLAYATKGEKWQFDLTAEFFGRQRLPDTRPGAEVFQRTLKSPSYLLLNAQILRVFKKWEFYLGAENLGNYMQQNPIINPAQPFGDAFDAGIIYAPIMGRMLYTGLRFTIE